MIAAASPNAAPLARLTPAWTVFTMALAIALLTASSWISVPMYPVPMTMQTFAVTLIGALFGWRLGALTVMLWLAQAAVGLPLLAGGAGGLAPFAGPTAGYLIAFPLAAALVGWLVESGAGRRLIPAFAAMLAGNLLVLALGGVWLAVLSDTATALAAGVTPFLLGAALKSALGAATLRAPHAATRQGPAT